MKKYIIILSAFVLAFGTIMIAVMLLEGDSFGTGGSFFTGGASAQNSSVFGSMSGEGSVTVLGGESAAMDNPEGNSVNQHTIVVDARLEEKDWNTRKSAGLTNEAIAEAMDSCKGYYAYDTIGEEMKQVYAEIYLIMKGHQKGVPLCTKDPGLVETASLCVLLDHPEIFYVDGYSYEKYMFAGTVEKILYHANYTMDAAEAEQSLALIQKYVDACMRGLSQNATDYEKVKYVYEFIILNTEYNLDAPENQNICSVFLYRESVCLGYAKAVQYLLQQMGVQCAVVTGDVTKGGGHAWNLVKVNGQYYYLDATWGDASYLSDNSDVNVLSAINYDYLCITTKDLLKTHIIDNPVEVPNCVMTIDNYYVKEGLYLNNLDTLRIENIFKAAYANNLDCISIRCADEEVFNAVQENLLDNQNIFHYLQPQTETLAYVYNREMYTYTFML